MMRKRTNRYSESVTPAALSTDVCARNGLLGRVGVEWVYYAQ
jgi:hypothetical protein